MGITIRYHAKAGQDKQIDDMIEFFSQRGEYNGRVMDFPFDKKWVKPGPIYQRHYEGNWDKYHLCIGGEITKDRYNGRLPDHYRGIIVDLDEGCEPLWFYLWPLSRFRLQVDLR